MKEEKLGRRSGSAEAAVGRDLRERFFWFSITLECLFNYGVTFGEDLVMNMHHLKHTHLY